MLLQPTLTSISFTTGRTFAPKRTWQMSAPLRAVRLALRVRRERKALLLLDARLLKDIGLSQADVYREVHRPFLDLPGHVARTI